jgi:hypothetical protein
MPFSFNKTAGINNFGQVKTMWKQFSSKGKLQHENKFFSIVANRIGLKIASNDKFSLKENLAD